MNAITALSVIVMFASMFSLDATEKELNWTEHHEIESRVRRAAFTFAISSGVFVWSILW